MLTYNSNKGKLICPNFKEILEELGYKFSRQSGQYRTRALYRHGQNSNALMVSETGYYDWGNPDSEDSKGSVYKLISLTTGEPLNEILKKYNADANGVEETTSKNHAFTSDKSNYFFVEEDHPIIYNENILKGLVPKYDYFMKRGISAATQKVFEAGFPLGKNMFGNRIIFPIRNTEHKIVGIAGRLIYDPPKDGPPKWKIKGYKKSFAYNWNVAGKYVKERGYVVLVESIGDLLALYESGIPNAVCVFGLYISPALLKEFISADVDIVISTNNDAKEANGQGEQGIRAAFNRKKELANYFNSDKIHIIFPKSNDWNDDLKNEGKQFVYSQFENIENYVREKTKTQIGSYQSFR